ncbi:xanthine dehydrogenase accessory protein XdhC [Caenimonas sp. SL110]|uniref:xanthine dehydrogenase accessory protein XdhC n=1 Tax=Caenimonas sp. SL110 TaxID=1450524 RepID=UPI000654A973|nr:xanthine dehydrogenase accessory protein XdhC [Caenimonas sp. SL110]
MNVVTSGLNSADAVLVTVTSTRGSVPRERGAWMLVFADHASGTIGGGHLELQAMVRARQMLAGEPVEPEQSLSLGPALGQCCGGVVSLAYEFVRESDLESVQSRLAARRLPVALFGGGHVGRAIVDALSLLPFDIRWIDSRDEIFPAKVPAGVTCEHSDPVQAAVRDLAAQSRVLIMSFSHAEDLDIVAACLARLRDKDDLAYVGLIGSRTKWATFRHRLQERGFTAAELDRITCPIGIPGIVGKEPEIIAASVAAQILQLARDRLA